jgi:hypothetical protein
MNLDPKMGFAENTPLMMREPGFAGSPELSHAGTLLLTVFPGLHPLALDRPAPPPQSYIHVVGLGPPWSFLQKLDLGAGPPIGTCHEELKQATIRLLFLCHNKPMYSFVETADTL